MISSSRTPSTGGGPTILILTGPCIQERKGFEFAVGKEKESRSSNGKSDSLDSQLVTDQPSTFASVERIILMIW